MRLEDEIAQKDFPSIKTKTIVNLIYTNNWLESNQRDFFKPFGITSQQFNILRILRELDPKAATIGLLKERMLDKMCDVSRMVERLRLKKLINRQLNVEDRRAVDIVISDKGLALLQEIDQYLPNFEQVATPLTVQELEELNVLLDKIRG